MMLFKENFSLNIISRVKKIISQKNIDENNKEKSINIIKKIISQKIIDKKDKEKFIITKRK